MAWAKPEYKRGEVDRAGDFLINPPLVGPQTLIDEIHEYVEKVEKAYTVINNWRSSHSYPLQAVKMALLKRARRVDTGAVVAQRIKRLSSITSKLKRNPNMKLSQMQDLGGCRAVLGTPRRVGDLVKLYEESIAKNPHDRPEFVKMYDYISGPKTDGYRSVHLIYKYRTKAEKLKVYEGLRIEIQLRSKLQHAWATAVETVSTFTGQALKSNVGEEEWKRFFALMGSAIAAREATPTIPNTPTNAKELTQELSSLAQQLDVINRLTIYGNALQGVQGLPDFPDAKYFLLELDLASNRIAVRGYKEAQLSKATNDYLTVEKSGTVSDAVLVSVDSMANLRRAYPNYFLDTRAFVEAVHKAISLPSPSLSALRSLS
jgi:ppGpp synthetase/RelA/SpoT-type nucleotidyltranferase